VPFPLLRLLSSLVLQDPITGYPLLWRKEQIILSEDYEHLPTVNLLVQNVGPRPAKNVTFAFSAPVEGSDGYLLSACPSVRKG
jgi:hypothetical protein